MTEQPSQTTEQPSKLFREAAAGMFAAAFSLTGNTHYLALAASQCKPTTTEKED